MGGPTGGWRGGGEGPGQDDASTDGPPPPDHAARPAAEEIVAEVIKDAPMGAEWRDLALRVLDAAGEAGEAGGRVDLRRMSRVAYVEAPETDSEAWFGVDPARRVVLLAFRGTETTSWKDFVTDAMAWRVPWTPGGDLDLREGGRQATCGPAAAPTDSTADRVAAALPTDSQGLAGRLARAVRPLLRFASSAAAFVVAQNGGDSPARSGAGKERAGPDVAPPSDGSSAQEKKRNDDAGGGARGDGESSDSSDSGAVDDQPLVHFGFLRSYGAVRERVLAELAHHTRGHAPGWTVICTGHSLGGALATLAAADLRARHPDGAAVSLVTFGQPKVGNAALSRTLNGLCADAFRVVNDADAVARSPAGDYYHGGRGVRLDGHGGLWVEGQDSDDNDAHVDGRGGCGGDGGGGGASMDGGQGEEQDDAAEGDVPVSGDSARPASQDTGGAAVSPAGGGGGGGGVSPPDDAAPPSSATAGEAELLDSLTSGGEKSLEHHLENAYLDSLSACVAARLAASAGTGGGGGSQEG